ncbi:unnamed protein product [Notodromas monacha]|uniref:Uncharacterized protein n=1 Tax=Notodromas monacha TaxID=399045 RepID=A0A7R9BGF4_9CRUS|nr:unnamed protein product [Notodromas monacha]CAG0913651.1 unnamed protein product [Notodromas monacha]
MDTFKTVILLAVFLTIPQTLLAFPLDAPELADTIFRGDFSEQSKQQNLPSPRFRPRFFDTEQVDSTVIDPPRTKVEREAVLFANNNDEESRNKKFGKFMSPLTLLSRRPDFAAKGQKNSDKTIKQLVDDADSAASSPLESQKLNARAQFTPIRLRTKPLRPATGISTEPEEPAPVEKPRRTQLKRGKSVVESTTSTTTAAQPGVAQKDPKNETRRRGNPLRSRIAGTRGNPGANKDSKSQNNNNNNDGNSDESSVNIHVEKAPREDESAKKDEADHDSQFGEKVRG